MEKEIIKSVNKITEKASNSFSDKLIKAYYLKQIEDEVQSISKNPFARSHNIIEAKAVGTNEHSLDYNSKVKSSVFNFQEYDSPRIISIGGGKGGIGKSFLSANIGIRLASMGLKVSVVDLDLGGANLHTCLGMQAPKVGISDYIHNRFNKLEEVGIQCSNPNLTLYGAGHESWQQIKPQNSDKTRLILSLQNLDADYVILDLGAGTYVHTLDFFIFSHTGILVVTPEPTSIENAYVFIKSILYRKIQSICKAYEIDSSLERECLNLILNTSPDSTPFSQLEQFLKEKPEILIRFVDLIKSTNVGIIMNQIRTREDHELGESMSKICAQYFGFDSQFLGSTRFDDAVWKSIRVRKPLMLGFPNSVIASNVSQITNSIINRLSPKNVEDKLDKFGL